VELQALVGEPAEPSALVGESAVRHWPERATDPPQSHVVHISVDRVVFVLQGIFRKELCVHEVDRVVVCDLQVVGN